MFCFHFGLHLSVEWLVYFFPEQSVAGHEFEWKTVVKGDCLTLPSGHFPAKVLSALERIAGGGEAYTFCLPGVELKDTNTWEFFNSNSQPPKACFEQGLIRAWLLHASAMQDLPSIEKCLLWNVTLVGVFSAWEMVWRCLVQAQANLETIDLETT